MSGARIARTSVGAPASLKPRENPTMTLDDASDIAQRTAAPREQRKAPSGEGDGIGGRSRECRQLADPLTDPGNGYTRGKFAHVIPSAPKPP